MIEEKSDFNFTLRCDICGKKHEDSPFSYYDQAEKAMEKSGWKTRPYKNGIGYDEICPKCLKSD